MSSVNSSAAATILIDGRRNSMAARRSGAMIPFGTLHSSDPRWQFKARGVRFEATSVWRATSTIGRASKTQGVDPDLCLVGIVADGQMEISSEAADPIRVLPGECFSISAKAACELVWRRPSRSVLLVTPAHALGESRAAIPSEYGRLDVDPSLLRPIYGFTEAILKSDALGPGPGAGLLQRLLREQVVAILRTHDGRARDDDEDLNSRASSAGEIFQLSMVLINERHTDESFLSATLAKQVGVSLRQLQRIFSDHGTTVSHEIRTARAQRAKYLLGDRRYAAMSRDAIARHSGFSSARNMRLAFSRIPD